MPQGRHPEICRAGRVREGRGLAQTARGYPLDLRGVQSQEPSGVERLALRWEEKWQLGAALSCHCQA
jgi:hypothetical protein